MRGSGITIAAGLAWLGVGRNGSWSENNGLLDFIYSVILIIVYGLKKGFLALLLALAAKAKKINSVSVNLETGFFGNLLCQVFQAAQIGVDDFFAPRAYQMGVRVRFVAVITVASIRKANLYDFIFLLKQSYRLVDCRDAGSRKLISNSVIDPLNARMPFAGGQHLQHSQPLRGDPKIVIPKL
jgi:hypothetical protein